MQPELLPDHVAQESQLATRDTWLNERVRQTSAQRIGEYLIDKPLLISDIAEPEMAMQQLAEAFINDDDESEEADSRVELFGEELKAQYGELSENEALKYSGDVLLLPEIQAYAHNRVLGSDAELKRDLPKIEQQLVRGIGEGIATGHLPHDLTERADKAFRKTVVRVADERYLRSIAGDVGGVYVPKVNEIIVQRTQMAGKQVLELDSIIGHEFVHQLSGGTFKHNSKTATTEAGATIERSRTGHSSKRSDGNYSHSGLNEAMVEHVTCAVLYGDFETIDPDKRSQLGLKEEMIYKDVRKLTARAIDASAGWLTPKIMTNALFEETGLKGSFEARKDMVWGFVVAFGYGSLRRFDRLCELAESSKADVETLMNCIVPPVYCESGVMTKQGSINLPYTAADRERLRELKKVQ